ncbi:MAG TPA: tyrosine-type recombinase/integrase [Streptosporangiaceae bacterium]|nr:tyrosine-type recombinase/integrase [Streptosporangiaceae bacterium]
MSTRRRRGEDGISFEHRGPCRDPHRHRHCPGLWRGELTVGYTGDGKRQRRKVSGKTKAAVIDKLRDLRAQLDTGITPKAGYAHYTLRQAAEDWLAHGLEGRSAKTVTKNRNVLEPILAIIGARKLRDLTAADVRQALAAMAAEYSTAAVSMGHLALKRAIRHAEASDLVSRNVAALADTPKGQEGRPSRSLTLDQALAVITAAATLPVMELRPGLKDVRRPAELMHAYITLSLLCGLRTEEARALRWAHVDLDGDPAARPPVPPHVAVWRSVRVHGETKTERSRRTLGLPAAAVQALRAWADSQAGEQQAAGQDWRDTGLVFTTHNGDALDAGNVRKMFKRICAEAGIGDGWTPRELRTTFVSLMSHQGVAIEEIARLAGHASTRTTEIVYRSELRPVITTGAEIMDQLFTGT